MRMDAANEFCICGHLRQHHVDGTLCFGGGHFTDTCSCNKYIPKEVANENNKAAMVRHNEPCCAEDEEMGNTPL
jgi:hypothetical protein